tara:strand:- start:13305 stop:13610 length:306 start_codon:yes stop_codon:yes gene_type:complete
MSSLGSAIFPQSTSILNAGKLCVSDKEKFVNEESKQNNVTQLNPFVELMILLIAYSLITYIYFVAFKFASEDGLTFPKFLLAYFFTIPFIIVKLVYKSSKK